MHARHALVWIEAQAWQQMMRDLPPAEQAICSDWQQHGWPLAVRRQSAPPGFISVGIAPPPNPHNGQKTKIAMVCPLDAIVREESALPLAEAIKSAPPAWQASLIALNADFAVAGIAAQVYGSLAWQALTGQAYLHAGSDIDLSLPLTTAEQLAALAHILPAQTLPLDGELIFPGQMAVAWKEWLLQDQPQVMVKQERVWLCSRQHLLQTLS